MLASISSWHAAQPAAMVQSCACAATINTGQDAACVFQQLLGEHCQHVKKLDQAQIARQFALHYTVGVVIQARGNSPWPLMRQLQNAPEAAQTALSAAHSAPACRTHQSSRQRSIPGTHVPHLFAEPLSPMTQLSIRTLSAP